MSPDRREEDHRVLEQDGPDKGRLDGGCNLDGTERTVEEARLLTRGNCVYPRVGNLRHPRH
jgi:hypothetical protein